MVKKIPKVSRIAEIPQIYKKTKVKRKTKKDFTKVLTNNVKSNFDDKHDILIRLIYAKLYYLNKGSYKNYKKAKILYAEYASKNYEAVKTLPKEKIPQVSIWGFSPLLPFYAIRYARILITDMFRKKTSAEKELMRLTKENIR